MEVEWLIFRDGLPPCVCVTADSARQLLIEHLAIHFVGRGKQNERAIARQSRSVENIESSNAVGFEIAAWISDRSGHGNLRREVINLVCIARRALNGAGIANVSNRNAQSAGLACGLLELLQVVLHAL